LGIDSFHSVQEMPALSSWWNRLLTDWAQAAYSPDGKILAGQDHGNGRWGSSTYLWRVATRRVLAVLSFRNGGDSPLAFSPDGRTLAIADGWDGTRGKGQSLIRLWSLTARRTRAVLIDPGGYGIAALAYSPDGRTLAATGGQKIYLWNT
jgi:WD40 repeat protein